VHRRNGVAAAAPRDVTDTASGCRRFHFRFGGGVCRVPVVVGRRAADQ